MDRELDKRLITKLGLRSGPTGHRLRRALRRAPGWVNQALVDFERARSLQAHPKLSRQLDTQGVKAAFRTLRNHLDAIDVQERRKDFWLGVAGSAGFGLLVTAGALAGWIAWNGQL